MMKLVYDEAGHLVAYGPNVSEYEPNVPPGGRLEVGAAPAVDRNIVPRVVTRRQALLALLAAGNLDQVEQHIQSSPRAVQIAWEAAGTFERDNPLIEALAQHVGLSAQDVDNLFIQAAAL